LVTLAAEIHKMLRTMSMIVALSFVAILSSTSTQAQSPMRMSMADSCRSECDMNVSVCLKYLEACHQPGAGCDAQRAACQNTHACIGTCR
jgi:fructose/tagatose bisphosphate aldolase